MDSSNTGAISPLFLAKTVNRRLLPWEHEIIDILGCTEDEYKLFLDRSRHLANVRPAEYAHIPDIDNDATVIAIVVSLAIGLVSTGVSYLLAPKPPSIEDQRGGSSRTLGSRTGPQRFASTYGFESAQELAQYSDTVPIIWTKYTGETGGVLVSPKLVWSRIRALGGQQVAKLMYVVGESSVTAPDLEGIFIGNNSISGILNREFAFWWKTAGEVERTDLLYGTQQRADRGDPDIGAYLFDIGLAPGSFSGAYVPSNNLSFGLYSGIPNGTPYKVNWRVVSIPETAEGTARLKAERRKIAGPSKGHPGMYGNGCGWARRQGLVAGNDISEGKGVSASVGDVVSFRITNQRMLSDTIVGTQDPDTFSLSDIDNTLDAECQKADTILALGETIQIGQTLWKVKGRQHEIWDNTKQQWISLECVELLGDNKIGIPPDENIWSANPVEEDTELLVNQPFRVGVPFYPLCKTSLGLIKNTRPCDSTEVNIRSVVWTRLNGICNFQTIPRPSELIDFDSKDISVQSGTQQLYDYRTSVFTVHYRAVGETSWTESGAYFCVRGASTTEQYNSMRFRHPERRAYEFRFIPVASPTANNFDASVTYVWLNASSSSIIGRDCPNGMLIECPGSEIGVRFTEMLDTMRKDATATSKQTKENYIVTGVKITSWSNYQAYMYAVLGRPTKVGEVKSATITAVFSNKFDPPTKTRIQLTGKAYRFTDGSLRWPRPVTLRVVSSGYDPRHFVGAEAIDSKFADGNNPNGITGNTSITLEVSSVSEEPDIPNESGDQPGREFEGNTQIAEISFYGDLINHSCDDGPEHQIVSVNEFITTTDSIRPSFQNLTTVALAVRSSRSFTNIDQLRVWVKSGVNNSNSFPLLVQYLLQNNSNSINDDLIDYASITSADAFCQANNLFFDGAISEKVNLRSYITEIAPFFLCNFVIKNGKFGIQPALPLNIPSFPVRQIFTANNIIDGSLTVEFLSFDQRRPVRFDMLYRINQENELPRNASVQLRYADEDEGIPTEALDMTQYCTSRDHAITAGKYLMSVRRRITRTVTFKTTPEDSAVEPGALVKIALEQTSISDNSVGVIDADGKITSTLPLNDGDYLIVYYTAGAADVQEATLTVASGETTQTELYSTLFALKTEALSTDTYMVERVELDEEGLVSVVAVNYPVDTMLADITTAGVILEEDT